MRVQEVLHGFPAQGMTEMSQSMKSAPLAGWMVEHQNLQQCLIHRFEDLSCVVRERFAVVVRFPERNPKSVEDHVPPHPIERITFSDRAACDNIPERQVHGLDALDSQSEIHSGIEEILFAADPGPNIAHKP